MTAQFDANDFGRLHLSVNRLNAAFPNDLPRATAECRALKNLLQFAPAGDALGSCLSSLQPDAAQFYNAWAKRNGHPALPGV